MADYIWPLSKSSIPNEINTSFGPRINTNRWDFHDGIDLPAPIGTKVYALRGGIVYFAGEPEEPGTIYDSRQIILEVDDPQDGLIYVAHLHLNSIDPAVTTGVNVVQGQLLGEVGDHGAQPNNFHVHLEMLLHTPATDAETSRHPLKYLPYSDTANFTAPVADRFNRLGLLMAARLLFGACNKSEGDLIKVEVDLLSGTEVLATRVVDFHDKATINKKRGNSDTKIFTNDIGVEGYQKSPMNDPERTRTDLKYGILVRNIPHECDTLIARVFDVGGNSVTSAPIPVPNQTAIDEFVDFEDGMMPPMGWNVVTSTTGTGTTVANDTSAGYFSPRGMLCVDDSATETKTQRAGIEYTLPAGRFEWRFDGCFNPTELGLAENQSIHLLHFRNGENLSVAARIRNEGGLLLAGIVANDLDGDLKVVNSSAHIEAGVWRRWGLHLFRIGTRETTAVLYLDEGDELVEQARVNWDSTALEPLVVRAGIASSSPGAEVTIWADNFLVTESSP